jgi:LPS-assembly lipoprotein
MIRSRPRFALAAAFALFLSACGFQLRDALTLPPGLGEVRVISRTPYSALVQSLERSLDRAGANVVGDDAEGVSTLRILSEKWDSLPIAVDQFGRAQEYTLRHAAVFVLTSGDGRVLVPQQAVELSRDYVSVAVDSTGTDSEREILMRELQREMASSILRRIDAASRNVGSPAMPPAEGTSAPDATGLDADAVLETRDEGDADTGATDDGAGGETDDTVP